MIQKLFAAGMSLQSTAADFGPGADADRVLATVDDLDSIIRQIRTSIFRLSHVQRSPGSGLRAQLLDVAIDLTPALGFEPTLRFSGPTTPCATTSPTM